MIDTLDKKIIYELDNNARITYKELARICRVNRSVIAYRIKKLEAEKIILGYFTEINNTALGFIGFRVFFKFSNYDSLLEKEFMNYLLKDSRVAWAFSVKGKWDVDIIYWCRSRFEFYELMRNLKEKFGNFILQSEVSTIMDIHHYPKSYLAKKHREGVNKKILGKIDYSLNETEKSLLEALAHNARKDVASISDDLKISINTVVKYLKLLIKKGIILGFRPFIDINKLGYNYFKLHINLNNFKGEIHSELISFLKHDANVVYINYYINGADLEIEYHVENEKTMYLKLDELREKFGKIFRDYFILKFEKEYAARYVPLNLSKKPNSSLNLNIPKNH